MTGIFNFVVGTAMSYKKFDATLLKRLSSKSLLPLMLLVVSIQPALAETSVMQVNISRDLEKDVVNLGKLVTVQLNCSMVGNITGLIITERFPIGFNLVNVTSNPSPDGTKFDQILNEFKWLFISLQGVEDVIISYTVEVPVEVEESTYVFEGEWNAAHFEERASGLAPTTEILVEKASSEISCIVSASEVKVGESVTVSGSISPAHDNVTVTLSYAMSDNSVTMRNVTTSADGRFTDVFKVDAHGSWSVVASWLGDQDSKGAESSTASFTAEKQVTSSIPPFHVIAICVIIAAITLIVVYLITQKKHT